MIAYISVQDKNRKLKFLQKIDETHKSFLKTFGINSIYSFQKIATFRKIGFDVFKGWFFDHIFETRGNFQVLFISHEKKVKTYKNDLILLQEYNILQE